MHVKWNPDFSNLQRETKIGSKNRIVKKSGTKLQCVTGEGKRLLVRVIGMFEKSGFHTV